MSIMKKINSIKEIPNYLHNADYSIFSKLSKQELYSELELRTHLMQNLISYMNSDEKPRSNWQHLFEDMNKKTPYLYTNLYEEKKLFEGPLHIFRNPSTLFIEEKKKWNESFRSAPIAFASSDSITVCRRQLSTYTKKLNLESFSSSEKMYIEANISSEQSLDLTPEEIAKSVKLLRGITQSESEPAIIIQLCDIGSYDDFTITERFKDLLGFVRNRLNIKEPVNPKPHVSDFSKVFTYKSIQFYDLTIWELLNSYKIKQSVLAVLLHPTGDRGETELKQTDIPFFKKIFNNEYYKSRFTFDD